MQEKVTRVRRGEPEAITARVAWAPGAFCFPPVPDNSQAIVLGIECRVLGMLGRILLLSYNLSPLSTFYYDIGSHLVLFAGTYRDGSVVKNIGCYSYKPEFGS